MQRLGVSTELPRLLSDFGVDIRTVLQGTGFAVQDMRAESWIEFPTLLTILERAAEQTGCEHLGLLLGLRFDMKMHGIIGQLMQSAPTLGQALEDYVTWQPGYSSGAVVYLLPVGDEVAFGYGAYAGTTPGTWVLYDAVVGVAIRMLQHLAGKAGQPEEVELSHGAPADPSAYARLLRLPMRFNERRTSVLLRREVLRTPLASADPVARRAILTQLQQVGRWSGTAWANRVRHEVRRAMFADTPSMPGVAERLQIGERTLRRKLALEGTTFEVLRDEVGFLVSSELIELTDLPMSDIAAAIGFASPSVFSESFHRWAGKPPSRWRKQARQRDMDEAPLRGLIDTPRGPA